MNDHDLDHSYSALCEALSAVGKDKAELFLATLALALISHADAPHRPLESIAQARRLCLEKPGHGDWQGVD
jgi:hypothetical protein